MRPIRGLVCDVVGDQLKVELENGDIATFPKRDGLRYGDRVFVGYDYRNMCIGKGIVPCERILQSDLHELKTKNKQPSESDLENMRCLLQECEELGGFEADGFEDLRSLLQEFEDVVSSSGE